MRASVTLFAVLLLLGIVCGPAQAAVNYTYTYNAKGQVVRIDGSDGKSVTFGYDAAGNLISRTTAASQGASAAQPVSQPSAAK